MAQGMNQGMTQGKAELLKRQIIRRFKKLPKLADARIDNANTEQLEAWAEAIFDAQDIKQLLGRVAVVSQPNIVLLVNMLGCLTDGIPTYAAENRRKETYKPTAERILKALSGIILAIIPITVGTSCLRWLMPLSVVQQEILNRLGLSYAYKLLLN